MTTNSFKTASAWLLLLFCINARELLPSRCPSFRLPSSSPGMNQHLAVPSLWEVGSLWCMGVSGAFCALRSAHCPRGKLFELGRQLASDQRTTLARIGHDTLSWQGSGWHVRPRLAVLRSMGSGRTFLFKHHLATVVSNRARSLQVTFGTHVWASVHVGAFLAHVPLPPPLPRAAPRRLLLPCLCPLALAVFLTSWPPPCSVPAGWGVWSRGFSLENAAARICREVGARVLPVPRRPPSGSRCRWSAPLRWCSVDCGHHYGFSCSGMVTRAVVVQVRFSSRHRQRKQLTYPMLWVVFAAEVEGRWLHEAFVSCCGEGVFCPPHPEGSSHPSLAPHRWCSLLACASALSLLEQRPALGCDGDAPSTSDVVSACRPLPLVPVL